MTDEIRAVIEKNLPAQVGDVLKKTLEQGQKDAAEVVRLKTDIEALKTSIVNHLRTIDEYKKKDSEYNATEAKAAAVAKAENDIKVTVAELKLAESEKRTADAINFVGMVFKSPVFRKIESETDNWQSYYPGDGVEHRHKTGGFKETITTQE